MEQELCCLTSLQKGMLENSLHSQQLKNLLNEAFINCKDFLLTDNLITQDNPFSISSEGKIT